MPDKEQFADLVFPVNGLDLSMAFGQQRQGTTPVGKNVVVYEPLTSRGRGGSRPGVLKYIPGQIPGGPHKIQHLNIVVDPSGQALLDNFDPGPDSIDDLSNDPPGIPRRNFGRRIRIGRKIGRHKKGSGSGRQPSRSSKKQPKITWPTPADISEGTPLDASILNATATDPVSGNPVPGNFVYTPPSGTVLMVGDGQVLSTNFTPNDTKAYKNASASVLINVKGTGIKFVQAAGDGGGGTTSVSCTMTANVTKGNLLLVFAYTQTNKNIAPSAGTVTVADSQGNVYVRAGNYFSANLQLNSGVPGFFPAAISAWYTYAGSTGACTATIASIEGNTIDVFAGFAEYSGVKATGALEGVSAQSGDVGVTVEGTGNFPVSMMSELAVGGFISRLIAPGSFLPQFGANQRLLADAANVAILDFINPPVGFVNLISDVTPLTFGGNPINGFLAFGLSLEGA